MAEYRCFSLLRILAMVFVLTTLTSTVSGDGDEDRYDVYLRESTCGMNKETYICDIAEVLSIEEEDRLNKIVLSIGKLENSSCVLVVLVDGVTLPSSNVTTMYTAFEQRDAVRDFAESVRDTFWNSAFPSCGKLMVIGLDVSTTKVWTATTRQLRPFLSSRRTINAGEKAEDSYFSSSLYFSGIEAMLKQYKEYLDVREPSSNSDKSSFDLKWWQIVLIVLGGIVVVGLFFAYQWVKKKGVDRLLGRRPTPRVVCVPPPTTTTISATIIEVNVRKK